VSSKTTISTNCVNCPTGIATGEVEITDKPTPYMVYCSKCDHSWAKIHTPDGYVVPGTPTVEGFVKPGTEIDVKRFYLPGVTLRATCPKCNHPWVHDMAHHYLSYPVANVPFEDNAYCPECEHEWTFRLRLNLSLGVVE
jgi:hypothetical protein